MKPRLLIISTALWFGGGEVYLRDLLPALNTDYQVTLLAPNVVNKFLKDRANTKRFWLFPRWAEKMLRRNYRLKRVYYSILFKLHFLFNSYDLINLHVFEGAIIESIKPGPLVVTEHTGFLIPRKYDAYVRRVLGKVSKIICVSSSAKQQLLSRGIPTDKIDIVHNGVDVRHYKFNARAGEFITWVGRVEAADKNPMLFIKIAQLAQTQGLAYRFRLVGTGSYLDTLKDYAHKHQLSNIEFSGYQKDMSTIYKQASLLCMTSTSEGLPLTALEAMACGVPVIATNVGGLSELISKPEEGILIDGFSEAEFIKRIANLLGDQKRYETMRQVVRRRTEDSFNIDETARKIKAIYAEAMQ